MAKHLYIIAILCLYTITKINAQSVNNEPLISENFFSSEFLTFPPSQQKFPGSLLQRVIIPSSQSSIKLAEPGKGFVVKGGHTDVDPAWGGHWYGLSHGDKNKLYLNNVRASSFRFPVSLNGKYGIGFQTFQGKMAFLQNGILTIGLDDNQVNNLKDNSASNQYKLYVADGVRTEQVVTDSPSMWSDFVFYDNYELLDLKDLEKFISKNKHLPDIPSEKEIVASGMNLAEMDSRLLQKVEELTLYVINLEELHAELTNKIEKLRQ